MPIYVRNVKLGLDEPQERLVEKTAKRLRIPPSAIRTYATVRRSLDARRDIAFVYCLEVALSDAVSEPRLVRRLQRDDVTLLQAKEAPLAAVGTVPMRHRPLIVGFGPAGMFAGLQLARHGYRPLIVERGRMVRQRHRDILRDFYRHGQFNSESNLLYGEGGAGTYSDGKLYTRLNDPYVPVVLQVFFENGARPDVLIDGKPHIGSDRLPNICMRIRRRIEELGGEVRFSARLDDLVIDDERKIRGAVVNGMQIAADHVLLAMGHSARDTFAMLQRRGVKLLAKPFQLGVRIEHPQEMVDRWQYGALCGDSRLPPAEYHLVARGAAGPAGDLFTFCMCPGGVILPTNEAPGLISTNGASREARHGPFANCGLVVTIHPQAFGHDPFQGIAYQRAWESRAFVATGGTYAVPAQRASDFLDNRMSDGGLQTSYPLGGVWTDLHTLLPANVGESVSRGLHMLDQKLPGFAGSHALLTAPETRASGPVRIVRNPETRVCESTWGLYPVGEGAGYAGGIISAAIDGIKSANALIRSFAPCG